MISARISFLGGSAFRMIWGEVSSYFSKKQDHAQKIERMRLQSDLEKERHARDCERLRLQSDLGVKEVEVQRDADLSRIEGDAWRELVASTARATGIKIIEYETASFVHYLQLLQLLLSSLRLRKMDLF